MFYVLPYIHYSFNFHYNSIKNVLFLGTAETKQTTTLETPYTNISLDAWKK